MEPFRVQPSDIYFTINYVVATDAVTEVRVTGVARGSTAEKIGIRKGDRLATINGVDVAGKRRRNLLGSDGRIRAVGKLTFEGTRGLFGQRWSVTVESSSLREKNEPNKSPTLGSVTKAVASE